MFNHNLVRALRRREIPVRVYYVDSGYDTSTGLPLVAQNEITTTVTPIETTGVFQQPNKFDESYADDLASLEEGQRLNFEGILWTEYPVEIGEEDEHTPKACFISVSIKNWKLYSVFRVRDKFYGKFNRCLLGGVDT